jgi:hypothetical protein
VLLVNMLGDTGMPETACLVQRRQGGALYKIDYLPVDMPRVASPARARRENNGIPFAFRCNLSRSMRLSASRGAIVSRGVV